MDPRKRRADFWSITTWVLLAILAIFLVLPIGRLLKEAVYTDGQRYANISSPASSAP